MIKYNVKEYEMKQALGKRKVGLIAQELQEVYPLAVAGNPYGDINEDPLSIAYNTLTPILIKAIQELHAQNDALITRIEILESR